MSIEAMKQAIEALEHAEKDSADFQCINTDQTSAAIAALRTAIQQNEARTAVRCEGCGYMTHHREHMSCVRAAKQFTHPSPDVPEKLTVDPSGVSGTADEGYVAGWNACRAAMLAAKDASA